MSENASTEQQSQPATEPTPQPPASTPPATGATEFRYGDDAPEYLRGKTPQETIAFVDRLVNEVQQVLTQPAAPTTQQRTMTQQQQIGLPDPDMALTDPKGYQQQLTQYLYAQQGAMLAQAATPVYEQLASTAKELSKSDPKNKDIWHKYGSQVEAMVANVPAHLRTKDLYDKAVVMVRGERFEELATEKAATLAAAGTGLARAGSADEAADAPQGDAATWEKIEASAMGAAAIKVAGKAGILKAIRAGAYKSLEDYATQAAASKSKVDSANPNIVYNRSTR